MCVCALRAEGRIAKERTRVRELTIANTHTGKHARTHTHTQRYIVGKDLGANLAQE